MLKSESSVYKLNTNKFNEDEILFQTPIPMEIYIEPLKNGLDRKSVVHSIYTPEKFVKKASATLYCENCFHRIYPQKQLTYSKSDSNNGKCGTDNKPSKPKLNLVVDENVSLTFRQPVSMNKKSSLTHRDSKDNKHMNLYTYRYSKDPKILEREKDVKKKLIDAESTENTTDKQTLMLERDAHKIKSTIYDQICHEINQHCFAWEKELIDAINEVKVLSVLKHPFIISYKESFIDHNRICIVMEYAAFGDLYQTILKKKMKNEFFSEKQVLRWFTQITMALKYLHDKHILHRDLKSQNLFLTSNGKLCLGDFGIAKLMNQTCIFAQTQVGTPYFLSPEICQNKPYTCASDIWALGCVLYELITLKVPFQANNLSELVLKITRHPIPLITNPEYRVALKQLMYDCLNRNWKLRPTAAEILERNFIKKEAAKLSKEFGLSDVTFTADSTSKWKSYNVETSRNHGFSEKNVKSSASIQSKSTLSSMKESNNKMVDNSSFAKNASTNVPNTNGLTNSKELVEKCLKLSTSMEKELKLYTNILDKCIRDSVYKLRSCPL